MKQLRLQFGGCGGLFTYFLGIAKYIQNNYNTKDIPIYASSGGVIPAFLLCSEYSIDKAYFEWLVPTMKEISSKNEKIGKDIILEKFLSNFMKYFNGRINLNILNRNFKIVLTKANLEKVYISEWNSLEDLYYCMRTSCWIPFFFEPNILTLYRNDYYLDGSLPSSMKLDKNFDWISIDIDSINYYFKHYQLFLSIYLLSEITNIEILNKYYRLGYLHSKRFPTIFSYLCKK